jgi:2,3-bisphosphoglycerate-independent phosphoglycerate mutase
MDRDKHWERTSQAYAVLTGTTPSDTFPEGIEKAYAANTNDEYVVPFVIAQNEHPIQDNDAVFFFNFREDRMRQIAQAFTDPSFSEFPVKKFENLFIATMTEYKTSIAVQGVAFEKEIVKHPLGEIISRAGKTQLRIAETEKYAHVTYFFNGLREEPFPNEYRVLIPSKNIARHEEHPEMMAAAITDRAVLAMNEGAFDFILINYANADIIAHTGKYDATLKAIQTLDKEIGRLLRSTLEGNHVLVITSDHGNAESVINLQTGEEETKHNANPVPFYVVAKELAEKKEGPYPFRIPTIGIISDVAPTLLSFMGIPKPEEMTGQNLMEQIF